MIAGLFTVKVLAGCFNGWLAKRAGGSDTIGFNTNSLEEYQLLFSNPVLFFKSIFMSNYGSHYGGLFDSHQSYWNELPTNLLLKFLGICDIFSRGDYNINTIFYNGIIFTGLLALYRAFSINFKEQHGLLVIGCFLLPSTLFFGSVIHKDGIILAAIGVLVYNLSVVLEQRKSERYRILYVLLAFFTLFLFRPYVLLAILPGALAWMLVVVTRLNSWLVFSGVYLTGLILFFTAPHLSTKLQLPQYILQKQADFKSLPQAATSIELNDLQPDIGSFAANLPQAINHSFLRPFYTDLALSRSLLPLIVELTLYQLLLVLVIFFRKPGKAELLKQPLIQFGLYTGTLLFILIGYTVPVIGAIVRYRSIYLPFFIIPLLMLVDWEKMLRFINLKK